MGKGKCGNLNYYLNPMIHYLQHLLRGENKWHLKEMFDVSCNQMKFIISYVHTDNCNSLNFLEMKCGDE